METPSKAWIQTFCNIHFDILHPTAEMVHMIDIAHHLGNQCRFTGATRHHYSVAQHSFYCSLLVPKEFQFEALLHDAAEAYVCDMSRPLKHFTECGKYYRPIENRIQQVINAKFGIIVQGDDEMSPAVKAADNAMLFAEKEQLMQPHDWTSTWNGKAADVKIEELSPRQARDRWIDRFVQLADKQSLPNWIRLRPVLTNS